MKKLLILVLFISACSHFETKQQIAETVVKKYLDSVLNDPHSYESVSFGKLKVIAYAYEDTIPAGVEMKNKEDIFKRSHNYIEANKIRHFLDSIDFIYTNPIIKSYRIDHQYRAKNGFGALVLFNSAFVLTPDLKSVILVDNNN